MNGRLIFEPVRNRRAALMQGLGASRSAIPVPGATSCSAC